MMLEDIGETGRKNTDLMVIHIHALSTQHCIQLLIIHIYYNIAACFDVAGYHKIVEIHLFYRNCCYSLHCKYWPVC
jgi:hypothetical protein